MGLVEGSDGGPRAYDGGIDALPSSAELRSLLRDALAPVDTVPRHPDAAGATRAAVLVPLILDDEPPRVILTRRTEHLPRHPGEISFPGGLAALGEPLPAAALREAEEELGLAPAEVELLGALPPVHTRVTGILIAPFVGALDHEPALRPNPGEIAQVLVLSLAQLAEVGAEVELERGGISFHTHVFDVEGEVVWGATGRIVRALLDLVGRRPPSDRSSAAR